MSNENYQNDKLNTAVHIVDPIGAVAGHVVKHTVDGGFYFNHKIQMGVGMLKFFDYHNQQPSDLEPWDKFRNSIGNVGADMAAVGILTKILGGELTLGLEIGDGIHHLFEGAPNYPKMLREAMEDDIALYKKSPGYKPNILKDAAMNHHLMLLQEFEGKSDSIKLIAKGAHEFKNFVTDTIKNIFNKPSDTKTSDTRIYAAVGMLQEMGFVVTDLSKIKEKLKDKNIVELIFQTNDYLSKNGQIVKEVQERRKEAAKIDVSHLSQEELVKKNKEFLRPYNVAPEKLDKETHKKLLQTQMYFQKKLQQEEIAKSTLMQYQVVNEGFSAIAAFGMAFDKPVIHKIGLVGQQLATIYINQAMLTGVFGSLQGLAAIHPVFTIATAIFTIINVLKHKEDGLGKALASIMRDLQTISSQITAVHKDLIEGINFLAAGQAQIYNTLIESTRHLERTIYLELKSIKEPLFFHLSSISNRLLLLDQVVTAGIEGLELQDLSKHKDTVEHTYSSPESFQGDSLRDLKNTYKGLLAWSRTLCKTPNLTGKSRLQAGVLRLPNDVDFSADMYNVVSSVLGGVNNNISIKIGYLAEFARQVLDINIDTGATQNLENWLVSLKLLLKLQALFIQYEVLDFNTCLFELDSLIKTANDFHKIIRELQVHSDLLFNRLLIRYGQSYSLFLNQWQGIARAQSAQLFLADPRADIPFNLFDSIENMTKEMTLKQLIALSAGNKVEIELYLAPNMLRENNKAISNTSASDVNAADVILQDDTNFRKGLDVNKILEDFAGSPAANDIPNRILIGCLVGHGRLALRINETLRRAVTAYSPSPGVIHGNSPGSAAYAVSLIYKVNNSTDFFEVMSATYAINSHYHYVGNHDVSGNGALKMKIAINNHQAQFDKNYNLLSSANYFHLVWPKTKREGQPLLNQNILIDNDSLLLLIAKVKQKVLEKTRKDVTLQPYLARLDADYQLIVAFAELIGFNNEAFQQLRTNQTTIISSLEENQVNSKQQPLDPIMMLSSMNQISEGVQEAKQSDQLVSPVLIAIEDQLAQLNVRRAEVIVLRSGDEFKPLKNTVRRYLNDNVVEARDYSFNTDTNTALMDKVCGSNQDECINKDHFLASHQSPESVLSEKNAVTVLANKAPSIQTSSATRAVPFYFWPLQMLYQTIVNLRENIISSVGDSTLSDQETSIRNLDLSLQRNAEGGEMVIYNAKTEGVSTNNEGQYFCQPMFLESMPILKCDGPSHTIYVFPKGSDATTIAIYQPLNAFPSPVSHDHYDPSSCKPVEFYGQQSVCCEGERTTIVYQPHLPTPPFQNLDGQLMLFAVGVHLVKQVVCWFTGSEEKNDEHEQKQLATIDYKHAQLESLKTELDNIEKLLKNINKEFFSIDLKWIVYGITEYRYDIEEIEDKRSVTIDELEELSLDINYFYDEVLKELKDIKIVRLSQTGNGTNPHRFFSSSPFHHDTDHGMSVRNSRLGLETQPIYPQLTTSIK